MRLGEWNEASQDAARAAELDPDTGTSWERSAYCLSLLNRLPEAIDLCRGYLEILPEELLESEQWTPLLTTMRRIEQHEKALAGVETILSNPTHSEDESYAASCLFVLSELFRQLTSAEIASPLGCRLRMARLQACLLPLAGESGQSAETRQKWARDALADAEQLRALCPKDAQVYQWHARSLLRVGKRAEAQDVLAATIAVTDRQCSALIQSMQVAEAERKLAKEALNREEWHAVENHCDRAITADQHRLDASFSGSLFHHRSIARHKQGRTLEALEDINIALLIAPNNMSGTFHRGVLYMGLERYQEACTDFEQVERTQLGFEGLSEWLPNAQRWAERPPLKNYYAALGVRVGATDDEIKRAYRRAALQWHPDKHRNTRDIAEKRFKAIQEANEVLSDPIRRFEYDVAEGNVELGKRRPASSGVEACDHHGNSMF